MDNEMYKKAIIAHLEGECDKEKLYKGILANHPDLYLKYGCPNVEVKAAPSSMLRIYPELSMLCDEMYKELTGKVLVSPRNKAADIKLIRLVSGLDLREAKALAEKIKLY